MHGGEIYIRGEVEEYQTGEEVGIQNPSHDDLDRLRIYLEEYAEDFDLNIEDIMDRKFIKLVPTSHRPYGRIYTY